MATKSIGIDIREAYSPRSGKARYTLEITKALLKCAPKDWSFYLFTQKPHPEFSSPAAGRVAERIHQVCIPGTGPFWHWKLYRHLKRSPVDFFLAPTSYLFPAFAPKSQKLAIVVHDLIAFLAPQAHARFPTLVERLTLKRALKQSSFVLCVSQNTAQDLARLFPEVHKKPVLIATPAVSRDVHRVSHSKLKLPSCFILGVGTLSPRKNFGTLFEAFGLLAHRRPDIHVVIAGAEGWKTTRIYQKVPALLKHRIHFLGPVNPDQLNELYSRAQILVFPSLYEGFGLPPLEAMACGCPVIVSRTSSLPEVVGDAALQVDPHDPEELANAIQTLLGPKSRGIYKKRGLKRARQFSWEESARRILARI